MNNKNNRYQLVSIITATEIQLLERQFEREIGVLVQASTAAILNRGVHDIVVFPPQLQSVFPYTMTDTVILVDPG